MYEIKPKYIIIHPEKNIVTLLKKTYFMQLKLLTMNKCKLNILN